MKTQNRAKLKHEYKPGSNSSEYYRLSTNTELFNEYLISIRACIYKSAKDEARIIKGDF